MRLAGVQKQSNVALFTSLHSPLQLQIRSNALAQRSSTRRLRSGLKVSALDAAMPFDYEHRAKQDAAAKRRPDLTIGLVGFGTFGQFLAKRFVAAGYTVIATNRSPCFEKAEALGVQFFSDVDDFCEAHPDVVILATSILSLEPVLASLPMQRLKRNTLFVDVLSVKEFPKKVLLDKLPPQMDILCTHPMYGPDSGKGSWEGLPFMYEKVRIGDTKSRADRCEAFLDFFAKEGCRMVEMSCEDHDKDAASTQFITHTVGRMLGAMGCESTPIDTKGYQSLLSLVDLTANDSFDLYYGLFMYNQNATDQLEKLEEAFDSVKRQLLTRLHSKLREQMGLTGTAESTSNDTKDIISSTSSKPSLVSAGALSAVEASNGNGNGAGRKEQQEVGQPVLDS